MAKYTINDTTLTSIADAIRAKGGTSAALTPAQMAEAIAAIQAGGGVSISLPTGYAMECGVFIPAENKTSTAYITLNNTYKWRTEDKTGVGFTAFCALDLPAQTASMLVSMHISDVLGKATSRTHTINASGTVSTYATPGGFGTNDESGMFTIPANSAFPLVAGVSYFYIVIAEVA